MTIDLQGNDRRATERLDSDAPISVVDIGAGQPAVLRNISRSGLCCVTRTYIPEMTVVALTVRLPALPHEDRDCYLFRCRGAVVRCEPLVRGNSVRKWETGVFFTDVAPEDAELLERYIAARSCPVPAWER